MTLAQKAKNTEDLKKAIEEEDSGAGLINEDEEIVPEGFDSEFEFEFLREPLFKEPL